MMDASKKLSVNNRRLLDKRKRFGLSMNDELEEGQAINVSSRLSDSVNASDITTPAFKRDAMKGENEQIEGS